MSYNDERSNDTKNVSHTRLDGNSYLNALLNTIPCGIIRCQGDHDFTLIESNDGFHSLVGYTREEIRERFQNRYADLIYPADLDHVREEVQRQTENADRMDAEYRLVCKDGRLICILEKSLLIHMGARAPYFYSILLDMTSHMQTQHALMKNAQRLRVIMEQTKYIIFDWDLINDHLDVSPNWFERFGSLPDLSSLKTREPDFEALKVHPDDIPLLKKSPILNEARYFQLEIRLRDLQGQYLWHRIRVTPQLDESGNALRYVGVITDIDSDKRKTQMLIHRAERDALTGLYNRSAGQSLIEAHLNHYPDRDHALLLLDLDDFKQLNDTRGHMYGDAVLSELSGALASLFRTDDVVSRFGGDEIVIFLRDVPSGAHVVNRANEALAAVRHLIEGSGNPHLTCSMGISLYPNDGTSFLQLYQNADEALYRAKSMGKNHIVQYDTFKSMMSPPFRHVSVNTAIDSDGEIPNDFQISLTDSAFDLLLKASDTQAALQLLLEIIGRRFDVNRVYIFENSIDGKHVSNTFEWCRENSRSQKKRLQNIPLSSIDGYYNLFGTEGVFYSHNLAQLTNAQRRLLESQGVVSVLQAILMAGGKTIGFIGVDEYDKKRYWTKEQVSAIKRLARVVSVFLHNLRLEQDRKKETAASK